MKLLFCDNSLQDFLNFRRDVVTHLYRKGFEILIAAPDNLRLGLEKEYEAFQYIPTKLSRGGMNPFKDLGYFLKLFNIYRKEKPDHIFHYTIKPNIYGVLAARLNRIPTTAIITGLGYAFFHNDLKSKVGRILYKWALRFPDRIIVLNDEIYNFVIGSSKIPLDKIIKLEGGEGVNLQKFR